MSNQDELARAIARVKDLGLNGGKIPWSHESDCLLVAEAAEQCADEKARADRAEALVGEYKTLVHGHEDDASVTDSLIADLERELAAAVEIIEMCVDRRINHEMADLTKAMNFLARHAGEAGEEG